MKRKGILTIFLQFSKVGLVLVFFVMSGCDRKSMEETFLPLNGMAPPQNYEELWTGYDPRAEPLDIEILKEWEEDNVVMRIVRYRVGVFKGEKAMVIAVYGFPRGAKKIPGLVQIHGGGQYADYRAVLANAKRGYATISISWAGRINAPDYKVSPAEVKLFWADSIDHPNYKLTTDWGALDGYHAPTRNGVNSFGTIEAAEWTLDPVKSPRNSSWFLATLSARRALTFLEQQVEVDSGRLGVYGHSMGGRITVLTAVDSRVKAAAPSCGGVSGLDGDPLFQASISDDNYLKRIKCPVLFQSPSNDFHSKLYDLQKALNLIKTDEWRVTCSAHHSHQDTPEFEVANILWFDQHLKNKFIYPGTPKTKVSMDQREVSLQIFPDTSRTIASIEVYYWQPKVKPEEISRNMRKFRFWHYVEPQKKGNSWAANLKLEAIDRPVWVYANVLYKLDNEVSGAGYYYGTYTADQINLSSKMHVIPVTELQQGNVTTSLRGNTLIESFMGDWTKDWFTYKRKDWEYRTHKINHDFWRAPSEDSNLSLKVYTDKDNTLVVRMDGYATEIVLPGGGWQQLTLTADQFKNGNGEVLENFTSVMELELSPSETLKRKKGTSGDPVRLGGDWNGKIPEFKDLKWVSK